MESNFEKALPERSISGIFGSNRQEGARAMELAPLQREILKKLNGPLKIKKVVWEEKWPRKA
jgi:hypothetical protein